MHSLIIGQTGSGKTTLGTVLAARLSREGVRPIVLDHFADNRWPVNPKKGAPALVFKDAADFDDAWRLHADAALFVDEAGIHVPPNRRTPITEVATTARHWGHVSFFLSQRVKQIDPNVRNQAQTLYLFGVTPPDAKMMVDEWGWKELHNAWHLETFQFYRVQRMKGEPQLLEVDPNTGKIFSLDGGTFNGPDKGSDFSSSRGDGGRASPTQI